MDVLAVPPSRQLLVEALGAESAQQIFAALPKDSPALVTAAPIPAAADDSGEAGATAPETEQTLQVLAIAQDLGAEDHAPAAAEPGPMKAKKPAGTYAVHAFDSCTESPLSKRQGLISVRQSLTMSGSSQHICLGRLMRLVGSNFVTMCRGSGFHHPSKSQRGGDCNSAAPQRACRSGRACRTAE